MGSHASPLPRSHLCSCGHPQVAAKHYGGALEGLLGELQMAFIAFVFGQSLDGYAQWKALLLLFLGCEEGPLHTAQPFFVQVGAQAGQCSCSCRCYCCRRRRCCCTACHMPTALPAGAAHTARPAGREPGAA